jgi:hypothetical protein
MRPTCFCSSTWDKNDLTGNVAERQWRWDRCFTMDFCYIHGGSVRGLDRSRYRQWMTHKLENWIDQFGTSGCVGAGAASPGVRSASTLLKRCVPSVAKEAAMEGPERIVSERKLIEGRGDAFIKLSADYSKNLRFAMPSSICSKLRTRPIGSI